MVNDGVLLAMGNPLLDISATVDNQLLDKYDLEANNAILAEDKHKPIYQELVDGYKHVEYIPGGASQNTMRVAQWILGKTSKATSYIGCIGTDEFGKILATKATEAGVNVNYLVQDEQPTGTCAVLITGKHRSLIANLAAANCYTTDHLQKPENWAHVEKAKYFYISGFFLTVSPESMLAVGKHASETNKCFAINLSAPFLCQFFKEPMMKVMPYVDILFGNETEAGVFAKEQNLGTEDLKEIAIKISKLPKVNDKRSRMVVITHGKEPTLVAIDGEVKEYPIVAINQEDIVDTNGAGDAFVGGFLSQLVQSKGTEDCVKLGHEAARYIIQQSGVTGMENKPPFIANMY